MDIFPKVDQFDSTMEALEKLTGDVQLVKEATESIRTEMTQHKNDQVLEIKSVQEVLIKIMHSLEIDRALQAATLIKMQEATDLMENEIKHLRDQSKNQYDQMRLDFQTAAKKLTVEGNDNKTSILTKIGQLKEAFQLKSQDELKALNMESKNQNEVVLKKLHKTNNSLMQKSTDEEKRDKATQQTETPELDTPTKHAGKRHRIILAPKRGKRLKTLEAKSIATNKKDFQELQNRVSDDDEGELPNTFLWKISGFKKKWEGLDEEEIPIKREEWFTNHNGLLFTPRLTLDYPHVYIELYFESNIHSSFPFVHCTKFILLDQSRATEKENVEFIDRPGFQKNYVKNMMTLARTRSSLFCHYFLEGRNKNKYIKRDTILIRIIFEPISILWQQIQSRDGVFLWRIDDYSKKMEDACDGAKDRLSSEPFTTSRLGYTAFLELNFNGTGSHYIENREFSISLYFQLGLHDASLPSPFKCKITFCLMDQSNSPKKKNISQEHTSEFVEGEMCDLLSDDFLPYNTVQRWRNYQFAQEALHKYDENKSSAC